MRGHDDAAIMAATILGVRHARSELLPAELFHEPAWDLLLHLFVADAEGHRLTGRDVSDQLRIPHTVMSRWLLHLTRINLIVGDGDGNLDDELTLSGEALTKLEQLMTEAANIRSKFEKRPLIG